MNIEFYTREKYDCAVCGMRIEKKIRKCRDVAVRIFEDCSQCGTELSTFTLIDALYGVSQPRYIQAFIWATPSWTSVEEFELDLLSVWDRDIPDDVQGY